jgi:hypothetical protein
LKRKISFFKNDGNAWSKYQNWKKHETQILINQMLKDEIKKKNQSQTKGFKRKKKEIKE